MNYSKGLNCSSEKLVPGMAVEDDTNAYAARNHKVFLKVGKSGLWSKKPSGVLAAYVYGECGYTALFAESYAELLEVYESKE